MEQNIKPKVTATDFFLYLGYITTFYVFIVTYVTFLFSLINTFFPDRLNNYYDPYGTGMRFSVSMLIVATPLFLFLLRKIYSRLKEVPERNELWVRRWGLYLTLSLSVAALAIDLVVLINTFLGGEITTRFTLKALAVILIGLGVWWHTKQELHNTIALRPKVAKGVEWGVAGLVLISIITGFYFIGSPTTLRNIRDDIQRENDLSTLKYQVVNYYQTKNGVLPTTLDELILGNPYQTSLPKDPVTDQSYGYQVLAGTTTAKGIVFPRFELCATFKEDGSIKERMQNAGGNTSSPARPMSIDGGYYPNFETDFSMHPAGNKCFEVTIDPELFKPFPSPANEKQMMMNIESNETINL